MAFAYRPVTRRRVGGLVGALFAGVLTADCSDQGELEEPFLRAKNAYTQRQGFVDKVVVEYPPPTNLKQVIYQHNLESFPNPLVPRGGMVMRTEFSIPPQSTGESAYVRTEVYRSAFSWLASAGEFINALVDHEYNHVEIVTGSIGLNVNEVIHQELERRVFTVGGDMTEIFLELEAFYNQLKAMPNRPNISKDFRKGNLDSYKVYRNLVKMRGQSPFTIWLLQKYPENPI